jgi:hypothetical protein
MGVSATIAILEHKKEPFLKAFQRTGKVAPATRAVRISRDAVYDWLRDDSSFRRRFNEAKRNKYDAKTGQLSECMEFFLSVVKPIVPSEVFPRIVSAINLTLATRKFKDGSTATGRTASRKSTRLPSFDVFPESANSENGGSRDQGKNGTVS